MLLRSYSRQARWPLQKITRAESTNGTFGFQVYLIPEATQCPTCNGRLKISKTATMRTVTTMAHGMMRIRETVKKCADNPSCPPVRSEVLAKLVPPYQQFGYDVITYVGLARYLRGKQRQEIQVELTKEWGIKLSEGTVSHLCDRFLIHLEALHRLRAPTLKAAMRDGYALHIDSTNEKGKGNTFVCMDGIRGWVLAACRISTEKESNLLPSIKDTVAMFGDPVAIVRDLGKPGTNAVQFLRERGIPDLICHYHFLAVVGEKLFDGLYTNLRASLSEMGIYRDLKAFLKELDGYHTTKTTHMPFGPETIRPELPSIVLWILVGNGKKNDRYPFSLPHLYFTQRCQKAPAMLERWLHSPRTSSENQAIQHLAILLDGLNHHQGIHIATHKLTLAWKAFFEFRETLRITSKELPGGRGKPSEMTSLQFDIMVSEKIEKALKKYRELLELRSKRSGDGDSSSSPPATILRYLIKYWDHLFGHPIIRNSRGNPTAVVHRTNNPLEHFFGHVKRNLRRRLGKAHLGRDLQQQPAEAMLACNLKRDDYIHVLCGALENLPVAFSEVELAVTRKVLDRDQRNSDLRKRLDRMLQTEESERATE